MEILTFGFKVKVFLNINLLFDFQMAENPIKKCRFQDFLSGLLPVLKLNLGLYMENAPFYQTPCISTMNILRGL
jgi:hypothetical protein